MAKTNGAVKSDMGCMYMAVNSKQKGARFEREVANAFKDAGFTEARRSAQYCGNTGDAPDVMGVPELHIECKHYKDTEWDDQWYAQAKRDCHLMAIPVVIHKTDRKKPKVRLSALDAAAIISYFDNKSKILVEFDLEDFIEMFKQYDQKKWRPKEGDGNE